MYDNDVNSIVCALFLGDLSRAHEKEWLVTCLTSTRIMMSWRNTREQGM